MAMKIKIKSADGKKLTFPSLPDKINVSTKTVERSYSIIGIGTIAFPHGNEPVEISWKGVFFGEDRKKLKKLVSSQWIDPDELVSTLTEWKEKGEELRLVVSGTFINYDVAIKSFDPTPVGGHGDVEYTILFREFGSVKISKKSKSKKKKNKKKKTKPRKDKAKSKLQNMTVNARDGLHLRSGPNATIYLVMPNGAKLTTDGKMDGNWYHVCYKNQWGYAYSAYLKKG
jgi:hypothetical protein